MLRLLITRNGLPVATPENRGESAVRRLVQDLAKVARGGPALAGDAARAIAELALARLRHAVTPVRDLPLRQLPPDPTCLTPGQQALLARVTYVVPRIGRRLPWRSDCLVQALAARRWLGTRGIAGVIRIGGRINPDGQFEGHAWLTVGDVVVTGWDIERFAEFAPFPLDQAHPGDWPAR